ncbi:MAG: succinylglutamate desuccinylase/aspartoacylase family protein [Candidatus Woesearchaeota archaeon]|nr:succinylglutamate desuccinylase/aspartoacylase family protein [Candidatus Woesearchaeota archaeon]
MHGDEILGKDIARRIKKEFPEIEILEGNPRAIKNKKRFMKKDLNRIFPGKIDGDYEEKLAHDLKRRLKRFDYVIDIHTTTTVSEPFLIMTKKTAGIKELVDAFPLKDVVFMNDDIAKSKALIDHVKCGVSVEFTKGITLDSAYETIKETIENICSKKKVEEKRYYEIIKIIEKAKDLDFISGIRNFELIGKDTVIAQSRDVVLISKEEFYPVFYGQKSFFGFLCMKARLIEGDIYDC